MTKNVSQSLGNNKIEQMSINSEVDIEKIISLYQKNVEFFLKNNL